MKLGKVLRIIGVTLILALALAAIPAVPALAANNILLSLTSGKVGDSVTVTGTNFSPSSSTSEHYANVIFALDNANVGASVSSYVHTYKQVGGAFIGYSGDPDEGELASHLRSPRPSTMVPSTGRLFKAHTIFTSP